MDTPLGRAVGNALEVIECIDVLKGGGPQDLIDVSIELTVRMLLLGKVAADRADAEAGSAREALLLDAARTHLEVARRFPAERARCRFFAAELQRDAGHLDDARPLYEQVAGDPEADDELRVRALARGRL